MHKLFAVVLVFVCVTSFVVIIVLKIVRPDTDVTLFVSIFVASFTTLIALLRR